ncbi:cyanophycinase [Blastomonas sp. SL216]|uniref:cyanophycinase n=1 Tax=Blastomonas sp. SL216 TaxID=2995169 RepID=UPI0023771133|nr:cyanophycinase [Blastomonas sp. SL216]
MRLWGALCLGLMAAPALADPGTVVVVGGALLDDNATVYRAMIDAMPKGTGNVVIIPAASGIIGRSVPRATQAFVAHGIAPSRIRTAHVAMVDDPDTADLDESRWASGASDSNEIAKLADAGLIWFLGGDQLRIIAALLNPDGSDSPMLATIRKRLEDGAVVGGTSAGAAVMGEHMIACGSPDVALTAPVSRDLQGCEGKEEDAGQVPLVLGRGLGFLPGIVFDQHFSERGRLPRLVRAVACIEAQAVTGVGVDEDTGFVFDIGHETGHPVGSGTITVIDPSEGHRSCDRAVMENVRFARFPAMKD